MTSNLDKALRRFDSLSEKELAEFARKLIRGSALERKSEKKIKTRSVRKA